jgi:chromosome segregation ATPase
MDTKIKVHTDALSTDLRETRKTFEVEKMALAQDLLDARAQRALESTKAVALLEKVYARDARVADLEAKINEFLTGGGRIQNLERKLDRRQVTIAGLHGRIAALKTNLTDDGANPLPAAAVCAERAARAETELHALQSTLWKREQALAEFEERQAAGQSERLKLRAIIKTLTLDKERGKVTAARSPTAASSALKEHTFNETPNE